MNAFKTPKGTELPFRDLRGQQYLDVKYRLVWFREERPKWSLETEIVQLTDVSAIVKATVRDEAGRVLQTAHKFENKVGFADFHEKAETGAIGRALAMIGYGTQFAQELESEGDRIVDSPVPPKAKAPTPIKSPAMPVTPPKAVAPAKVAAPKVVSVPALKEANEERQKLQREIGRLVTAMSISLEEVDGWIVELFKKEDRKDLTNAEMQRFINVLMEEAGRNGVSV